MSEEENYIKIVENLLLNAHVDYEEYKEYVIGYISFNAIKNILSDYKRVLKELEEKTTILLVGAEKVKQLEKENEELKEKYDKDTHTLQNQLDIANADRVEKDKIIDLMANFMNKRSWKEHQVKNDICFCCKIEYSSEECVKYIKQYFKKKVRNKL